MLLVANSCLVSLYFDPLHNITYIQWAAVIVLFSTKVKTDGFEIQSSSFTDFIVLQELYCRETWAIGCKREQINFFIYWIKIQTTESDNSERKLQN
jgi:hypothetical protein